MTDTFDVLNPANGSVIQTITRDSEKAIEEKLEKGYKAFKKWKKTNAHERSKLLKDWSALIQKHKESIAKVMTEENGKPLAESRGDRKSTRLNSSHVAISYAVFCLKKKKNNRTQI